MVVEFVTITNTLYTIHISSIIGTFGCYFKVESEINLRLVTVKHSRQPASKIRN